MFNWLLPLRQLSAFPDFKKISTKIALGASLLAFLLNLQPAFSFPPLKQNIVHAQVQTPEQTQDINAKSLGIIFKLPHPGVITTYFSSFHPGIDLAAPLGTPIHPVAPGTVIDEGFNNWGLGLNVIVDHGQGFQSLYAHMAKIYVKIGQQVSTDDILGLIGLTGNTTGPHTHLQISKDGQNINPLTLLPPVPSYSDLVATEDATLSVTSIPVPTPTPPPPTPDPAQTLSNSLKAVQTTNIDSPLNKPSPSSSPLNLIHQFSF